MRNLKIMFTLMFLSFAFLACDKDAVEPNDGSTMDEVSGGDKVPGYVFNGEITFNPTDSKTSLGSTVVSLELDGYSTTTTGDLFTTGDNYILRKYNTSSFYENIDPTWNVAGSFKIMESTILMVKDGVSLLDYQKFDVTLDELSNDESLEMEVYYQTWDNSIPGWSIVTLITQSVADDLLDGMADFEVDSGTPYNGYRNAVKFTAVVSPI